MVHVFFFTIFFNRAMMMTSCDLCGITKPWKIQREVGNIIPLHIPVVYIEKLGNCILPFKVVHLVTSEFIQQGDIEREKFNENDIPVRLHHTSRSFF